MAKNPTAAKEELPPDQRPLNPIQAKRLAALAGVSVKALEGATIAQLSERLKWKIDPTLFLFRQICGKVVKKDPITGVEYPVPFATVHVEDTDCNFITYFPKPWPWGWHFPVLCRREVIGTTKTDACGNFCVWVPRFDIDWILRWRLERVCYPIIFKRPSIGDLIPKLPVPVVGPWPPIPGPDPGPLKQLTTLLPSVVEAIAGNAAGQLAQQVARVQASQSLGATNQLKQELLDARVFDAELPPPLPAEFQRVLTGQGVVAAKGASASEGIRSAVALKLGLNPTAKEIAGFNPRRFIGPFFRCYDVMVPEWQLILDVPDITFRVTQDTNGDGTEENIYSEGYFDVRWDAGPLPNVKLVASAIAKETRSCYSPPVPCGNVPAILFAGFMPLDLPAYYDAVNGYTLRPNRPSNDGATPNPSDLTRPAAQTPFCGTLQLYGCVDVGGAKYYRIMQSIDAGASFSAVTGLAWNNYLNTGGAPIPIAADASGWYPVNPINPVTSNPVPRLTLEFPNLILDWPTPALGQSVLKIEIGDVNKKPIGASVNVPFQTDNTAPSVIFTQLAWKFAGESDSALRNLLGIPCPTIHRGSNPQTIEVVFEVSVTAHHLRDASIGTSNCGGGAFVLESGTTSHWHTSVVDNSVLLNGRYSLQGSALEGAYSFNAFASSRAMNPSGADGGNLLPTDWYYDPLYIYTTPSIAVAIVDEN